jgi:type II secretory pathway component PulK
MANTQRGEVKIMLDKERTLKFNLNTLVEVEEKLGFSLAELGDKVSIKVLRTLLHAGLKHEDPELTEEMVGEMITMENIAEVQKALTQALGGAKN